MCERKRFVPLDFSAPRRVDFGSYFAEPLSTKDVDEDLQALLGNADMIVKLRGGESSSDKWPYTFTKQENYIDLAWVETCAKLNQLFAYVLRNKQDDSYAGCIYVYPIELYYPELANKYDVDFSFWITKKEYENGVYTQLFKSVLSWLSQDWRFPRDRIYLRNREIPESLDYLR